MYTLKIAFLALSLLVLSCQSLKYVDDTEFLNSAQANSAEFPAHLDGRLCIDMDGLPGACVKRLKSDGKVIVSHPKLGYGYRLALRCSDDLINYSVDVEKGKSFKYEIKAETFKNYRLFSCRAEVFPFDRANKISTVYEMRFYIFDKDYTPRERAYYRDGHIILGIHAKHSRVCDGKCKRYFKKTIVKASKDAYGWSESELGRFNFFGEKR